LVDTIRGLRLQQDFSQAVNVRAGRLLLHGQLTNTSVAVFVLPGVSRATVDGVVSSVQQAGGDVSILAHLSPTLVDPAKKTYVDSVATNSLKGMDDLASVVRLSPYARIGALLARAYTGPSDGVAVNDESRRIDAQLRGAKLVELASPLRRRGSAVIVLASAHHGGADWVNIARQIEAPIVDGLASAGDGLLVAGPAAASLSGGLIDVVRTSTLIKHAVATLDVADTPSGRVVAAAALAAAIAGQPGNFGLSAGKVVLPPTLRPAG
jgi:hypothetical protein